MSYNNASGELNADACLFRKQIQAPSAYFQGKDNVLTLQDTQGENNQMFFRPYTAGNTYNPITQADDSIIIAGDGGNNAGLAMGCWSSISSGVRVEAVDADSARVDIGVGGTSSLPTNSISFDETKAMLNGNWVMSSTASLQSADGNRYMECPEYSDAPVKVYYTTYTLNLTSTASSYNLTIPLPVALPNTNYYVFTSVVWTYGGINTYSPLSGRPSSLSQIYNQTTTSFKVAGDIPNGDEYNGIFCFQIVWNAQGSNYTKSQYA